MRIVRVKHFPPGGYLAINLFGVVFAKVALSAVDRNHERIHTAQMRELGYIPFYIWYVLEWLVLLLRYRNLFLAYRNIRFEKEAYNHEDDLNYLSRRKHYRYK